MFGGVYFGQDGFAMVPVYAVTPPPPPPPLSPPVYASWPLDDSLLYVGGSWFRKMPL